MVQVPLTDYGYANTRVRAMRSRLLDERTFDELLAAADYKRTLGILEDTEYGRDIEDVVLEGLRPTNIDHAFNINLARNFGKIKDFIDGRPRELIDALLARWDLYNLKMILRGLKALVPKAEITRYLVPAGELDMTVMEEIISQPDLRASLDAIVMFSPQWKIHYGRAVADAMADYFKERDLSIIELKLDRLHYREIAEVVKGMDSNSRLARQVVEMEVDALNIQTLLRLCGLEIGEDRAQTYYVPGGGMSMGEFEEYSRLGQIDELVEMLSRRTEFGEALQRAGKVYEEKGETVFQDELEQHIIRRCMDISPDPLGLGVIIGYMWRKYLEITNLRIIIRGKSIGMIESQIRKELFMAEETVGAQ